MTEDFVYLASGSPRRRELLKQIGVRFQVVRVNVDESFTPGEAPQAYVLRVARLKAEAGCAARMGSAPVLAADTAVVVDGQVLGKPSDAADCERMLGLLSGRTHDVLTAVALATTAGLYVRLCRSEVRFREIVPAEARMYWETGEPHDKAGGYAIQGRAAVFVADLRGSFSGVMGLPLFETAELLLAAGVPRWAARPGAANGVPAP